MFRGTLNIPYAELRAFSHKSANQCRYIAAEPPGPVYLACGNETMPGLAYCPHCWKIVHGPGAAAQVRTYPQLQAAGVSA